MVGNVQTAYQAIGEREAMKRMDPWGIPARVIILSNEDESTRTV